ncbi:hypothetical protein [Bdellovibrio bacteriovorus]|uniref:hypothetical protein n=1 Tax=Bdellovibrio bacteriovorus TaxID=959 RepID=UPI0035A62DA8
MKLLIRFTRILVALSLFGSSALAQLPTDLNELVLTGDLYGRKTVDFRKKAKNIQSLIPEGSEGKVLETRKLSRTGSYGIRIRLTKVNGTRGKLTPKEGDETWVYFSQKDPWLTFKDKEGSEVQDPEIALTSRAKRDGEGLPIEGTEQAPHLPTKEEVLREQKPEKPEKTEQDPNLAKNPDPTKTEGGFCAECSAKQAPTVEEKNREDLNKVKQAFAGIPKDNKWANDPLIARYSTSKEVEKAIKYGMRNKEVRSKKLCYRYVKRALLGGDLVDDYLPGSKARYGVGDLKRRGFKNLLEDPKYKRMIKSPVDAPKGAILIYRNTRDRNHAGHAEIKTDWGRSGGYVSDFYRKATSNLYNRELIGVMIKENP